MWPLGFLECSIKIQERVYQHEFIVCQNMVSAVILGIDFLRKFNIRISWGDQGRIKLKEGTHNLIHSVSEAVHYPVSLSKDVTVPPRTVASVVTLTDLPEPKIMYKMITADDPCDPRGNAITYPLCYTTMVGGKQKCAQIMVNLGEEKLSSLKPWWFPEVSVASYSKLSHDDLGHNGTARTYMLLRRSYYWKGMRPEVTRYVKQCKLCQTHNSASTRYVKGMFEVPKAPMDFISMDLIRKFNPPSSQGNKFTLMVICMLSGWTWCIPIVDKSAPVIVQAYLKNVHHLFGPSRKILSDNGSEFKNQLFETVAQELGIEHKVYSPPFRPQSNGRIEGFHAFLKVCLAKHVSQELEWDEVCLITMAAYNFLLNEHSRESPFFIMFGRDPRIPLTEILGPHIRYLGTDETILSLESLCKMYLIVAENLQKARMRDKNHKKWTHTIWPNDLVMVKKHLRKTFEPKYGGTFRVLSIKGNQAQITPVGLKHNPHMVHVSHLKQVFPAIIVIDKIPDYSTFGRKTKLAIHPDQIPDLGWHHATTLNTLTGQKSSLPSLKKRGGKLRARKGSKDRWASLVLEAIKTPL